MIGKLTGLLDSLGPDWAVIDVGGVGYVVHCSGRVLGGLGGPGAQVSLAVETVVREDMIRLYGFASVAEREWFRLLNAVQGVGARTALAIFDVLDGRGLAAAIAAQDASAIARANGVGPKLARRIVTELKDKTPALAFTSVAADTQPPAPGAGQGEAPPARIDAISALVNLGYAQIQAAEAVDSVAAELGSDSSHSVEHLIREGLKRLAV